MTKTLRTLGIINLVAIAITLIATFGEADEATIGLWAFAVIGLAIAQSIVSIVQYNKST